MPAPTPVIAQFSPASGAPGTTVTVVGSGFTGATAAWIGGARDATVAVTSDTLAQITVPADASTGTISIINSRNAGVSSALFTVTPAQSSASAVPQATLPQPTVSSFAPASGPVGTVITLTGTGFTGASLAWVGGKNASSSLTVISNSQARVTVPVGAVSSIVSIANTQYGGFNATKFVVTVDGGSTTGGGTTTGGSSTGGSTGGTTGGGSTGGTTGGTTGGGSTTGGTTTGGTTTGGSTTGGTTGGGTTGGSTGGTTGGTTTGSTSGGTTGGTIGTAAAARFLIQATYGPKLSEINALAGQTSFDTWLTGQYNATPTYELPKMLAAQKAGGNTDRINQWWNASINGPDQLRQRVAFALSELFVVSDQVAALSSDIFGLTYYYDILARDGFGNFRQLLEDVTLTPQMGHYLNMESNQKPDPANGIRTDENYAREIMQLFTVGLNQLNLDGSNQLDAYGNPIPTYTQAQVADLARVFTGWGPGCCTDDQSFLVGGDNPSYQQMAPYPKYHDTNAKTIIGGVVVPAGGTAQADLKIALDTLFNHPNVGPFVSKQLIQRLVTSNPSPAYVKRVATVFNNNGSGVRGDLWAVIKAILTDPEARSSATGSFGKIREPLIRAVHVYRAFDAVGKDGIYERYNPEDYWHQRPLGAPSVFNFFSPSYSPAGAIASAGLVAPELQITNTSTVPSIANALLGDVVPYYRTSAGYSSAVQNTSTVLDFRSWQSLESNVPAMVDQMNLVLMAGQMPADMRTDLINYASNIPLSEGAGVRLSETLYLLTSSVQFSIQY